MWAIWATEYEITILTGLLIFNNINNKHININTFQNHVGLKPLIIFKWILNKAYNI